MKYDLIVIGSGSAAGKPAKTAKKEGKKVAVVESADFGGTCALRGCMPKKVYLAAAEVIDWSGKLNEHGVKNDTSLDWSKVQEFKKSYTNGFKTGIRKGYEKAGIDIIEGRASIKDENTINVNGKEYVATNYVIATGAKPRPLTFQGSKHLVTSKEFLELDSLPKNIVFVGGGYISFEFAHIASRAGSNVTILQRDNKPLPMFEREIVKKLLKASKKECITVELNTEAKKITKERNEVHIHTNNGVFQADMAVHGAGRVPQIDDLQLENAGIKTSRKGIEVNEYLQTSQKHIYAGGDCCASKGFPLTPIASLEGAAIAHNLLNEDKQSVNYTATATALFTIPTVASVGMQEKEAVKAGHEVVVNKGESTNWFSSSRINVSVSGYKIIIDKNTDKILGAHLIGHNAEEVINLFAASIKFDITRTELKNTPWAYPTMTSDTDYML